MIRPDEARRPMTVSELAREIQRELRPLNNVFVKGEVSSLGVSAKGHYNFTIRDSESVLRAFLFAGDARRLGIAPEDGQQFIFRGRIDFWAQGGQVRLVVDFIQFDEMGRLRAQLEALKHRLELEGAFLAGRKRPLPFLPRSVALITSPTGAVIHDLQETIRDRFPNMGILVYPAQVQGTASPGSVVSALRRCNADSLADVVVIARGGGSFEELYAFNTDAVARAILGSRMPVVTALGHTSDRTVADLVADAECRTPTEAGARVVPDKAELLAGLAARGRRLGQEGGRLLAGHAERVGHRRERLRAILPTLLGDRSGQLERRRADLARLSPAARLAQRRERLAGMATRLAAAVSRTMAGRTADLAHRGGRERPAILMGRRLEAAGSGLAHRRRRLEALSPDRVLARGYSITTDLDGHVLKSAAETAPGRAIQVRLAAGSLAATVDEVRP